MRTPIGVSGRSKGATPSGRYVCAPALRPSLQHSVAAETAGLGTQMNGLGLPCDFNRGICQRWKTGAVRTESTGLVFRRREGIPSPLTLTRQRGARPYSKICYS